MRRVMRTQTWGYLYRDVTWPTCLLSSQQLSGVVPASSESIGVNVQARIVLRDFISRSALGLVPFPSLYGHGHVYPSDSFAFMGLVLPISWTAAFAAPREAASLFFLKPPCCVLYDIVYYSKIQ